MPVFIKISTETKKSFQSNQLKKVLNNFIYYLVSSNWLYTNHDVISQKSLKLIKFGVIIKFYLCFSLAQCLAQIIVKSINQKFELNLIYIILVSFS